jgi:hypothetical protein
MKSQSSPEGTSDIQISANVDIYLFTAMVRIPLDSTSLIFNGCPWLKHPHRKLFNFVGIQVNVSKYVGIVNHTSHPHVMDDGTVYNLGMTMSVTGPHYSIIKFPPPCDVGSAGRYTLPI